jgi:hypothetical protein
MTRTVVTIALVFFVASVPRPAAAPLVVNDINGHTWTPLAPAKGETNLLLFVSADCPVSARYAPEIDRIASQYASHGVRTFLIYADLTATVASVRENMKAFHPDVKMPAVIDAGFQLTTAVNATITPEAAVYSAGSSTPAYLGRIDDLYIAIGKARREALHHDLRDALDAVLAGRPVAAPRTDPVGCYIEKPKGR